MRKVDTIQGGMTMTAAEIKAELCACRAAVIRWRRAQEKADAFRQSLTGGKVPRCSDVGGTHERDGNSVENSYIHLCGLEADARAALDDMDRSVLRVRRLMQPVTDKAQRRILRRRYLNAESWGEVAAGMGMPMRQVFRLHGYALREMGRK